VFTGEWESQITGQVLDLRIPEDTKASPSTSSVEARLSQPVIGPETALQVSALVLPGALLPTES